MPKISSKLSRTKIEISAKKGIWGQTQYRKKVAISCGSSQFTVSVNSASKFCENPSKLWRSLDVVCANFVVAIARCFQACWRNRPRSSVIEFRTRGRFYRTSGEGVRFSTLRLAPSHRLCCGNLPKTRSCASRAAVKSAQALPGLRVDDTCSSQLLHSSSTPSSWARPSISNIPLSCSIICDSNAHYSTERISSARQTIYTLSVITASTLSSASSNFAFHSQRSDITMTSEWKIK